MTTVGKLRMALALMLLQICAATSLGSDSERLLDRRQEQFRVGTRRMAHPQGSWGDLGGTLHALAMHANVPICFESLPPRKGEGSPQGPSQRVTKTPGPRFRIDVADKTVGEILQLVVRKDPRYTYRERLGVIEVLPVGADKDPGDCLNMVVPALHVHYPWRLAWFEARCEVSLLTEHPGGVFPEPFPACSPSGPGLTHPPEQMLEATFENRSVRDILDELSSMAGGVFWDAEYDGPSPSCKNLVLGAGQMMTWYPPARKGQPWIEGLPSPCMMCHYHASAPAR